MTPQPLTTLDQALSYSLRLLSQRPYSEGRLRWLLVHHQTSPEHIALAVARLKTLNLLDDQRYARTFARSEALHHRTSQRQIARKLTERGVSRGTIETALAAAGEDSLSETERALFHARRYLRRHPLASQPPIRFKAWARRLARHLGDKGFPAVAIRQATDQLLQNKGDEV